jgi:hypothetical protein
MVPTVAISIYGNNGTLILNRGVRLLKKASKTKSASRLKKLSDNGLNKHWENFVRRKPGNGRSALFDLLICGNRFTNGQYRIHGQKLFWMLLKTSLQMMHNRNT